MQRQSRTIIITAVATLIVVLVLQNMRSVTVRFVVWDGSFSLALLLPLVFAGGVVAGWFWRRR